MLRKLKRKYWYTISVDLERANRKLIRWVNRLWLRIWLYIFSFWVLLVLTWGMLQFRHDYDLIHNYVNIDVLNAGIYSSWRTDGLPGQDPPKR